MNFKHNQAGELITYIGDQYGTKLAQSQCQKGMWSGICFVYQEQQWSPRGENPLRHQIERVISFRRRSNADADPKFFDRFLSVNTTRNRICGFVLRYFSVWFSESRWKNGLSFVRGSVILPGDGVKQDGKRKKNYVIFCLQENCVGECDGL